MLTYVIVFQYILKTGSSGEYPYVVWFLPGMSIWLFCSDAILTASNSINVKALFFILSPYSKLYLKEYY